MKKLYYSIGEVARMTGLEAHVLRYWESVFPMLRPTKSRSGARRYKEQDLRMVLHIQDLVHRRRYSTAGALKVLREQSAKAGSASPSTASPLPPPDPSLRPEPAGASETAETGETAEPASARQADMFATHLPQKAPTASPPDAGFPAAQTSPKDSPPAGASSPAVTRRFADNPDKLNPQMRLELLTIRELLKQLRDLL